MIFEKMNNKIAVIEKGIGNAKRESDPHKYDTLQSQLYTRFDDCVRDFQAQLLQIKACIDAKLDK